MANTNPKYAQCLVDFALSPPLRLQEDEELAVVQFKHHPRDVSRELRLILRDEREELLADHLLPHCWPSTRLRADPQGLRLQVRFNSFRL